MNENDFPNDISAETSVLAAIILDNKCLADVLDILSVDDFYRESHKVLFQSMIDLDKNDKPIDYISLNDYLSNKSILENVGGLAYILSLRDRIPTSANVKQHAVIVKEKSLQRKLIRYGYKVVSDAKNLGEKNVSDVLDNVQKEIFALDSNNREKCLHIKDVVMPLVENMTKDDKTKSWLKGIPIGYVNFDAITAGLGKTEYMILAARPSMGKTALALNIALNVSQKAAKAIGKEKCHVLIFSLEMNKDELANRLISAEAGIDNNILRTCKFSDEEWNQFWTACDEICELGIFIDDNPMNTVQGMLAKARKVKEQHGLDLIIIDYLQLIQSTTKGSRYEIVSEISRELKQLARRLEVPVLALSQLSRGVESRQVKRPMLSDLRESGALEQDADIVAFLYREDYYNPETENKYTELNIAKNRNGAIGEVKLNFDKILTKFTDYVD